MTIMDEHIPWIDLFMISILIFFFPEAPVSFNKKTISVRQESHTRSTICSWFARKASRINLLALFLKVALPNFLETANPMWSAAFSDGDNKTNAFTGLCSYFFPRVITLVKDPYPLNVSIFGFIRGAFARSIPRIRDYRLLSAVFFLRLSGDLRLSARFSLPFLRENRECFFFFSYVAEMFSSCVLL